MEFRKLTPDSNKYVNKDNVSVLNNVHTSHEAKRNKKFIGHDLLKNSRKFNNFDYNFNDWDDNVTQKVVLDYNLDLTLSDDDPRFHNFDIQTWKPGDTQKDTPMMFVTVSTTPNSNATTKTSLQKTTMSVSIPTTTLKSTATFKTATTQATIPKTVTTNTATAKSATINTATAKTVTIDTPTAETATINIGTIETIASINNLTKQAIYVTVSVNSQTEVKIQRAGDIENVLTEPTLNALTTKTILNPGVSDNVQTGTPTVQETIPRPAVIENVPTDASINPSLTETTSRPGGVSDVPAEPTGYPFPTQAIPSSGGLNGNAPTGASLNPFPTETIARPSFNENVPPEPIGYPFPTQTIPRPGGLSGNAPTDASMNPFPTETIARPSFNQNEPTEPAGYPFPSQTIPRPGGVNDNAPTEPNPFTRETIPNVNFNPNVPTNPLTTESMSTPVNNNGSSTPMNPSEQPTNPAITNKVGENPVTTPEVVAASDMVTNPSTIAKSTASIVMTFPKIVQVVPELNTFQYMINTDRGIHYPPGYSFPEVGPTMKPQPALLFSRPPTTVLTTQGDIVEEAHHEMGEKQAGYLTTFLMELFKIVATKNKTDAAKMFHAFGGEVNRLDRMMQLTGFGKGSVASFLTLVRTMNGVPPDVVQSQAALANYLLSNRRLSLSPEVVNLLDSADKIYLKEEGERMLAILQEIKDFPGTLKSGDQLAKDMMDAVVLAPFKRVYGTTKQTYLVQRLEEYIVKKFFGGLPVQRSQGNQARRVFRTKKKRTLKTYTTTVGTTIFIRVIRTRRTYTAPTPSKDTKRSKKTTISNKYAKFSLNRTIQKEFHQRMWRYIDRRYPKVWQEWRSKRTPTTTVPTTTARVKRKKKSIYVIKRYVKKKMKKRKTKSTTVANENNIIQYINLKYGKQIKLQNRAVKLKTKKYSKNPSTVKNRNKTRKDKRRRIYKDNSDSISKTEEYLQRRIKKTNTGKDQHRKLYKHNSDSISKTEEYFQRKIKKNYAEKDKRRKLYQDHSGGISKRTKEDLQTKIKINYTEKDKRGKLYKDNAVSLSKTKEDSQTEDSSDSISKKTNQDSQTEDNSDSIKETKDLQRDRADKTRRFKAEYLRGESSVTDEEAKLRANLDDALFHSHHKRAFKSENSQVETHWKAEKRREGVSSDSDVEPVLKSKIYKAFGYDNNFAQHVKRRQL